MVLGASHCLLAMEDGGGEAGRAEHEARDRWCDETQQCHGYRLLVRGSAEQRADCQSPL